MRFTIFLGILMFLLQLGCNKKENEKVEKGKLVVLKIHSWRGYAKPYKKDFIKHIKQKFNYDLQVEITDATGLNSFVKAIENKDVHLISPANDLLLPLKRKKLIESINEKRLSNYRQLNQTFLKHNVNRVCGVVYSIPFTYAPYAIAYNSDIMDKPKSYKELWNPRYRNRVSISGFYDTANIYMTALMLGYSRESLFNLNKNQLYQIEKKLKILCRKQVSEFWGGNLSSNKIMKYDIGTDWGIGVDLINKKYEKKWKLSIPDEGVTACVDCWAITKNVKNPNVEKVVYEFINYMISAKIQAKVSFETSYAPVNPYAGRFFTAKEKKKFYLADPKIFEKFILWKPLKKDVFEKYQKLWVRVRNAK